MDNIPVHLSVQEWNVVLNALATRPYAEVMNLIPKIKEEVEKQLPQPLPQQA
jgi:hypothetical protein